MPYFLSLAIVGILGSAIVANAVQFAHEVFTEGSTWGAVWHQLMIALATGLLVNVWIKEIAPRMRGTR